MQKYISLFFSVLLFAACKQATTPPPNIIEEHKMIKLLTDLHLTDGELYSVTPVPDTLFKYGREKYVALFKAHNVTEKQFDESYNYYSKDPAKIQAMYDSVSKILQAKLDSIRAPAQKPAQANAKQSQPGNVPNTKPDSVNKAPTVLAAQKRSLKSRLDSIKRSARKPGRPNAKKPQLKNALPQ